MAIQRLIQISDLHLREEPGDILCSDLITDDSLRSVLDDILQREGSGVQVLVTGDLVQDPVAPAYRRLRAILADYPMRFACLPGNHDDPVLMNGHLAASNADLVDDLALGAWRLMLLDSSTPGRPDGRLGEARVAQLRDSLARCVQPNVLVALHHHPVAVRSPWMDRMALTDSAALLGVIESDARVKGVVFGHVHQEVDQVHSGIRFLGTPSTCVQFAPHTLTMTLDGLQPAYRWLDLHEDGRIETAVRYLSEVGVELSA